MLIHTKLQPSCTIRNSTTHLGLAGYSTWDILDITGPTASTVRVFIPKYLNSAAHQDAKTHATSRSHGTLQSKPIVSPLTTSPPPHVWVVCAGVGDWVVSREAPKEYRMGTTGPAHLRNTPRQVCTHSRSRCMQYRTASDAL